MRTALQPEPEGVLVVDKSGGPTSHQVVARVRRALGMKRVGHAGTLDPMASGVLLVLIGQATKLSGYLTSANKSYEATVRLGVATDTLDAEGVVTVQVELDPNSLSDDAISQALLTEASRTSQTPPDFSAVKVQGRRAYALARKGQSLELPPRSVIVNQLRLLKRNGLELELFVDVSKGYYVRSLARDLGHNLGLPAHLTRLRRVSSGCFTISEAAPLPALESQPQQSATLLEGTAVEATAPESNPPSAREELTRRLMPLGEAARRSMPVAQLSAEGVELARVGKPLASQHFETPPPDEISAWLSSAGQLVAIGSRAGETFQVRRGFVG